MVMVDMLLKHSISTNPKQYKKNLAKEPLFFTRHSFFLLPCPELAQKGFGVSAKGGSWACTLK
jgi:hypothetical protein